MVIDDKGKSLNFLTFKHLDLIVEREIFFQHHKNCIY